MRDRRSLNIDAVRRRVRKYLIAEAREDGISGNLISSQVTSIGRNIAARSRPRGRFDRDGSPIPEGADSALNRLRDDLSNAKAGDVFYLTYGLAELEAVPESEQDLMGGAEFRYNTDTFDAVQAALAGILEIDEFEAPEKQLVSLQRMSSSLMTGEKMSKAGAKEIGNIQVGRIAKLEELLTIVTSDTKWVDWSRGGGSEAGVSDARALVLKAASEIRGIIDLADKDFASLTSENDDVRRDIVTKLNKAIRIGEAELTPAYKTQESRLISAAQMIAVGSRIVKISAELTGRPGTAVVTRVGPSSETGEYGRSGATGGSVRPTTLIPMGDSEALLERLRGRDDAESEKIRKEIEDEVANILLGSCSSTLCFKNQSMQLTGGQIEARLENAGLPTSVLMSIVEMLMYIVVFGSEFVGSLQQYERGKGKGRTSYWSRHTAGHSAGRMGLTEFSAQVWASHLDPALSIRVAKEFMGHAQPGESSRNLRRGSRVTNHPEARFDEIVKILDRVMSSAGRPKLTEESAQEIFKSVAEEYNRSNPAQSTTVAEVRQLAIWHTAAAGRKKTGIGRHKEQYRQEKLSVDSASQSARKRLHNPSEVARAVAKIHRTSQAERYIKEEILSHLLFGVTILCTGSESTTVLTKDSIKAARGEGASIATSKKRPVFIARIEMPKARATRMIEDPAQKAKMFSGVFQGEAKRGSYAGALETGGAISTPGEATRVKPVTSLRADIVTPNISLNLSADQVRKSIESGTLLSALFEKTSYNLDKAFKIPYIEKKVSTKQNMHVEDILALERTYDADLNRVKVTVQLLGAKKFHHAEAATSRITNINQYLTPIPEMGILPPGSITVGLEDKLMSPALEKFIKGVTTGRITRATGLTETSYNIVPAASYDVRERVVRDMHFDLKSYKDVAEAIKKIEKVLDAGGTSDKAIHAARVQRRFKRLIHNSHSMTNEDFDTQVITMTSHLAIESLIHGAQIIASDPVGRASIADSVATIISYARGSTRPESGFGEIVSVDQGRHDVVKKLSDLLAREVKEAGESTGRVVSASHIVLAAGKEADASKILSNLSRPDDPVVMDGQKPTVVPIMPAFTSSREAAKRVVTMLRDDFKIAEALSRIDPSVGRESMIRSSVQEIPSDAKMADIVDTGMTLMSYQETLLSHIETQQTGQASALETLDKLSSEVTKFVEKINDSEFGARVLKNKRYTKSPTTPEQIVESGAANSASMTTLSAFLDVADVVGSSSQANFESAIDDLISLSSTGMSAADFRASEKIEGQRARFKELTAGLESLLKNLSQTANDRLSAATLAAVREKLTPANEIAAAEMSPNERTLLAIANKKLTEMGEMRVTPKPADTKDMLSVVTPVLKPVPSGLPYNFFKVPYAGDWTSLNERMGQLNQVLSDVINAQEVRGSTGKAEETDEVKLIKQEIENVKESLALIGRVPLRLDKKTLSLIDQVGQEMRSAGDAPQKEGAEVAGDKFNKAQEIVKTLLSDRMSFDDIQKARRELAELYSSVGLEEREKLRSEKRSPEEETYRERVEALQVRSAIEDSLKGLLIEYNTDIAPLISSASLSKMSAFIESLVVTVRESDILIEHLNEYLIAARRAAAGNMGTSRENRLASAGEKKIRDLIDAGIWSEDMTWDQQQKAYSDSGGRYTSPSGEMKYLPMPSVDEIAAYQKLQQGDETREQKRSSEIIRQADELMQALSELRPAINDMNTSAMALKQQMNSIKAQSMGQSFHPLTYALRLSTLGGGKQNVADLLDSVRKIALAPLVTSSGGGSLVERVIDTFGDAFSGEATAFKEAAAISGQVKLGREFTSHENIKTKIQTTTFDPVVTEFNNMTKATGINEDQSSLIACLIGDKGIDPSSTISPARVAYKIIAHSMMKTGVTPKVSLLANLLQQTFFPTQTKKAFEDALAEEKQGVPIRIRDRAKTLEARAVTIISAVEALKMKSKSQDDNFFDSIAEYLNSVGIAPLPKDLRRERERREERGPIASIGRTGTEPGSVVTIEPPSDIARRPQVPGDKTARPRRSTLASQISMMQAGQTSQDVPAIVRPMDPSKFGGAVSDREAYASNAEKLRRAIMRIGEVEVGGVKIEDFTVADAQAAIDRGEITDMDLSTTLPNIASALRSLGRSAGKERESAPDVIPLGSAPGTVDALLRRVYRN